MAIIPFETKIDFNSPRWNRDAWARIQGDIATIGITDHAAHALSDLVYLGLPAVGSKLSAGRSFGEIESVKAVSDLNSPVDGGVIVVNGESKGAASTASDRVHEGERK